MNDVENSSITKLRIGLIATSSLFVSLPQLMWAFLGYRGLSIIFLESIFIILGFFSLIMGLLDSLPSLLVRIADRLWPVNQTDSFLSKHREKLLILQFLLVLYLIVPYVVSEMMGYTLPTTDVLIFYGVLTFLCVTVIFQFYRKKHYDIDHRQWPILLALVILSLIWTYAFWYGSPRFPTDEFTIDLYSAHLVLSGINPYNPNNTLDVFSYFQIGSNGLPVNVVTPYSTGGFVTNLSYPAISVLSFIPSVFMGKFETASMMPFYVIPPLIAYLIYHRKKLGEVALFPVFIILLNPSYLGQVGLGYSDIVWMMLTMLSLYFYKKPVVSGILMGAALSVKQIPWLLFPFMLIFLLRELGLKHSSKWVISGLLGFLSINAFFIIQNPTAFFRAILSPEFQQIIGIGFGPSQLSFLDILPIPRVYFSIMTVLVLIASIIAYSIYYDKMRYAFLAFPIIIFLFNYRLLLNYLLFWPLIALLLPAIIAERNRTLDRKHSVISPVKSSSRRHIVVPVLLVMIILLPAAYVMASSGNSQQISISSLAASGVTNGNVTGLSLTVKTDTGNLSYGDLHYRIMPAFHSLDMNGYLWKSTNVTVLSNGSGVITIVPDNISQNLQWNGTYRLIVYSGDTSRAITFSLSSGVLNIN